MAFIHCHKCGWEQDDFYSKDGYNPADWLSKNIQPDIFSEKVNQSIKLESGLHITYKEFVARYFEHFANKIRGMKWITYEDFKNDKNRFCPNCGSKNDLDID